MCVSAYVWAVAVEVREVLRRMAKTNNEDGEQQPVSIMAARAGRIGQLEFRITSRQPMATYLAHP